MITLLNKFDENYLIHEEDVLKITMHFIKDNNLELFLNDLVFDDSVDVLAAYNVNKNNQTYYDLHCFRIASI